MDAKEEEKRFSQGSLPSAFGDESSSVLRAQRVNSGLAERAQSYQSLDRSALEEAKTVFSSFTADLPPSHRSTLQLSIELPAITGQELQALMESYAAADVPGPMNAFPEGQGSLSMFRAGDSASEAAVSAEKVVKRSENVVPAFFPAVSPDSSSILSSIRVDDRQSSRLTVLYAVFHSHGELWLEYEDAQRVTHKQAFERTEWSVQLEGWTLWQCACSAEDIGVKYDGKEGAGAKWEQVRRTLQTRPTLYLFQLAFLSLAPICPALELLSLSLHVLTTAGFQAWLDLLEQRHAYEPCRTPLPLRDQDPSLAATALSVFLSSLRSPPDAQLLHALLATLGSFDFLDLSSAASCLPPLYTALLAQFDSVFHAGRRPSQALAVQGLATLVINGLAQKVGEWYAVAARAVDASFEYAGLATQCLLARCSREHSLALVTLGVIPSTELLSRLAACADLDSLLRLLTQTPPPALDPSALSAALTRCLQREISPGELTRVAQVLSTHAHALEVFASSEFHRHLSSYLSNSALLPCCQALLCSPAVFRFPIDYPAVTQRLLREGRLDPHTVATQLLVPLTAQRSVGVTVEDMFVQWMALLLDWHRGNRQPLAESVARVGVELAKVRAWVSEGIGERVVEQLNEEGEWMLNWAEAVAEVQDASVQQAFIALCQTTFRTYDKQSRAHQRSLHTALARALELLDRSVAHNKPHAMLAAIIEALLDLMGSVRENHVIERLLLSPSAENCWVLLIRHSPLLPSSVYLLSLRHAVDAFAQQVITHALTFGTYRRMLALSADEQRTLFTLLAISTEKKEALWHRYERCQAQLTVLRAHLAFLHRVDLNPAALRDSLAELEAKEPNTRLCDFVLIKDLQSHYDCAQSVQAYFNSGLYAYLLEQEKAAGFFSQIFSLRLVQELCMTAKASLVSYVHRLATKQSELTVKDVVSHFSLCVDVPEEVALLKRTTGFAADLDQVVDAIDKYRRRMYWIAAFDGVRSLHEAGVIAMIDARFQSISAAFPLSTDLTIPAFLASFSEMLGLLSPLSPVPQPFTDFLASCAQQTEMLTFASQCTREDLLTLQETTANPDSLFIDPATVVELQQLAAFLQAAKTESLQQFVTQGVALLSQDGKVGEAVTTLQTSWGRLKAALANPSASLISHRVEAVLTVAQVEISPTGHVHVSFGAGLQERATLQELEDLRDRADLYYQGAHSPLDLERYSRFVSLVRSIRRLKKAAKRMRRMGQPGLTRALNVLRGDVEELDRKTRELETGLSEWEATLHALYFSSPCLSLFQSPHFWILEGYLTARDASLQVPSQHLLSYAGYSPHIPATLPAAAQLPSERLQQLTQFLLSHSRSSFIESPILEYQPAEGLRVPSGKGILLYFETRDVVKGLISVYVSRERRMPKGWQVLWCRRDTQWSEVMAFLYRCFVWPEPALFAIVECERLSVECQSRAKHLFERLQRREAKCAFAVITRDEHSVLSTFFRTLDSPSVVHVVPAQLMQDAALLQRLIRQDNSLCCYVQSELPGNGKTFWIQNEARKLEKELVTVYVSGEIDIAALTVSLQALTSPSKALLLRLGPGISAEQADYVLACIVLFRSLSCSSAFAYFSFCPIFIEAEHDCDSQFLRCLPCHSLRFSLEDLEDYAELRYASLYLKLYDTGCLDSQDITDLPPDKRTTREMVAKYFIERQLARAQPVTYRNLKTFAKVIAALANNMENGVFTRDTLSHIAHDLKEFGLKTLARACELMRTNILSGLLATVEEVNTMTVSTLLSLRESKVYESQSRYEARNHFLALFLEDGSLVPVYREASSVPPYISQLIYLQAGLEKRTKGCLGAFLQRLRLKKEVESGANVVKDYARMSSAELTARLHACFSSDPSQSDYVMTSDNFVKMMLIYLRAISHLPIVIMGETGCGKTYLVQFFVRKVLREKLKVVTVHAGVTRPMLLGLFQDVRKEAAQERRFWVFLDEFNTSREVGLIAKWICDGEVEGVAVPGNVVIVAACNPLRFKPPAYDRIDIGLSRASVEASALVHRVNPIPDSLVDYVWDFGSLSAADTYQYIGAMVSCMQLEQELQQVCRDLLYAAHQYFQAIDSSLVSLRDITRFRRMVTWYQQSLEARMRLFGDSYKPFFALHRLPQPWPLRTALETALILAFCTCYLLRIYDREKRHSFLTSCLAKAQWLDIDVVKGVIRSNENDLLARMRIPQGVALNEALRENLCTLFQCVYAKVPVILCGKPGCSKSLSVQVLTSSCLGDESADPYLRTLPRLRVVSLQGSETCTSEGIEEAFQAARKMHRRGRLLPVIVFEEIGSAELSPHNPLKVLHSLLEQNESEEADNEELAFVGLSNWKLDASKMNRVVYLARPDPVREDLVTTAESLQVGGRLDSRELVKKLANTYVAFKETMKETQYSDYFGLRDFYHLVRQVTRAASLLPLSDVPSLHLTIRVAVHRNFSGYPLAAQAFLDIFGSASIAHGDKPLSPLDLILMAIKDAEARNLLLLSKGDAGMFVVESSVQAVLPRFKVFIGSALPGNADDEEYAKSILKQVIVCMEQGVPVLMKALRSVWSGLYNLFNQNYVQDGHRRYCQVGLGSAYNVQRHVHAAFKAVVFLEDDLADLQRVDAAFLNRFEKQEIRLEDILQPAEQAAVSSLEAFITKLTRISARQSCIHARAVFPLCSKEWLRLLVRFSEERTQCVRALIAMAMDDVLLLSPLSALSPLEQSSVHDTWMDTHSQSLEALLLAHTRRSAGGPNMVLFVPEGTEVPAELQVSGQEVCSRYLSSFSTEKSLCEDLFAFYHSACAAYLLSVSLSLQGQHLTWLRFVLDKVAEEATGRGKVVCVLIHIRRNSAYNDSDVFWFRNWPVSSYSPLPLSPLLSLDSKSLLLREIPHLESKFQLYLQSAYYALSKHTGFKQVSHTKLQDVVACYPDLVAAFKAKLVTLIQSKLWEVKDWKHAIVMDAEIVTEAKTAMSAVRKWVEKELERALVAIVAAVERIGAFDSFLAITSEQQVLKDLWMRKFLALRISDFAGFPRTLISSASELKFPFSLSEIVLLNTHFTETSDASLQELVQKYRQLTQFAEELKELSSRELGDLYLGDFVRWEGEGEVVDVVLELHWLAGMGAKEVEVRTACYFHHRPLVLLLLRIFRLLHSLHPPLFPALSELHALRSSVFPLLLQSEDSLSPLQLTPAFCEAIGHWLEQKALQCAPSSLLFQQVSLSTYTDHLRSLYLLLKTCVTQYAFSVPRLREVELWLLLAQFAHTNGLACRSLEHLAQVAASSPDFLAFPPFRAALFELISKKGDVSAQQRLKLACYRLSLINSPNALSDVVDDVEAAADRQCVSRLLSTVLLHARLFDTDALLELVRAAPQDDYLLAVETQITARSGKSRLAVLLMDKVALHILHSREERHDEYVARYYDEMLECDQALAQPLPSALSRLICCAFVRVYLDQCVASQNSVSYDCLRSEFQPTFLLYVLKSVKRAHSLTYAEVREWMAKDSATPWPQLDEAEPADSVATVLARGASGLYHVVQHKLRLMLPGRGNPDLHSDLPRILADPGSKLDFLAAAYAEFSQFHLRSPHFRKSDSCVAALIAALDSHSLLCAAFVRLLESNFAGSFLRLSRGSSKEEVSTTNVVAGFWAVLVAHAQVRGPLTAPFFTADGTVHTDLSHQLNQYFLPGNESTPLSSDLAYKLEHFDALKSESWRAWKKPWVQGSAYKCSDTCDFVYFVESCGAPMRKDECPYCHAAIGGVDHRPVRRPGHVNLSDDDARRFIEGALHRYRAKESPGLLANDPTRPFTLCIRQVSDAGYYLLHLFLHCTLYFLYLTGLAPRAEVRRLINSREPEEFFKASIVGDLVELKAVVKVTQVASWVEALVTELPDVMAFLPLPVSLATRIAFEQHFDATVVQPHLLYPERAVSDYLARCTQHHVTGMTLLEEVSRAEDRFPLFELFRVRTEPDWLKLSEGFRMRKLGQTYPVLDVYVNCKADFDRVKCLYPLVRLTNYLMQKFSHQIAREEARGRKVQDALLTDPCGLALLRSFLAAWNSLSPFPLQYQCKVLNYIRLTENDSLCCFLPDNKELGGGLMLLAALIQFAHTQNMLLDMCSRRQEDAGDDVPVQRMKEDMSIQVDLSSPELLHACSHANPDYGRGCEQLYDYSELEIRVLESLHRARRLSCEPVTLVQYQFELQNIDSSESTCLCELRLQVPQKPLCQEVDERLHSAVMRVKEEAGFDFPNELRGIYSSLEHLLWFVKSYPDSPSFASLCGHLDPSKCHPVLSTALGDLSLEYLVAVYEEVEERYFPYLKTFVRAEFAREMEGMEAVVRRVEAWCDQEANVPMPIIRKVVHRFISRCLTGEANPSLSLDMYLTRSDLWPEDVTDDMRAEVTSLLQPVQLANTLQLYDALTAAVSRLVQAGKLGWE